jgi:large subunit ribosomal protein L13e
MEIREIRENSAGGGFFLEFYQDYPSNMKHNNVICNNHFRKQWEKRVKTWFDQAGRKKSRRLARAKKLLACNPSPTWQLRPQVNCPTFKYNSKLRSGKGFTIAELKKAGISKKIALPLGISVDHRRRNRSQEKFDANVKRLENYKKKLVVLSGVAPKGVSKDSLENIKVADKHAQVINQPRIQRSIAPSEIIDIDAYSTLREARDIARYHGIRAKRAKEAEEKMK